MDHDLLLHTLAATLRLSTPLILCAMAGLLSERSGIVDIGLEGKMLVAAFAAASVAAVTGSPWLALISGIVTATAFALLHGYACITQRGNQVVSGVAINLLASGLTVVLGSYWFQQGGQTPLLTNLGRFRPIELPGVTLLGGVPFLGPVYRDLVSGHNLIV